MRNKSVKQFAIVIGDSAQQFTETLNKKLVELEGKDVTVDFYENFLGARIYWTEKIGEAPESIEEEYEMIGAGFKCRQCPMYYEALKADGTVDMRAKFGKCIMRDYCKVNGDQRACERLYDMIQRGEVQLCLAELEG
jgi:hypothetical protein